MAAKVALLGLALVLSAAFGPWTSKLGSENPLVGKIYSNGEFISAEVLKKRVSMARFVLLGEVHDNPDHHRLQAELIRDVTASGRRPLLVLEMLPRSAQGKMDAFFASGDASASAFGTALDWEKRGWPDWEIYQPILEAALESDLKIVAGNIDRKITRNVAQRGFDALQDPKSWGLNEDLPEELAAALNTVLMEGHCNLLPESALPAMRKVQRARDASMADAMVSASKPDGAILITGSGHVRADFAVPHYLGARGAGEDWLAVQFVPVADEETDPSQYVQHKGTHPARTISIFTPRIDDKDHCAELRGQLSKKKKTTK